LLARALRRGALDDFLGTAVAALASIATVIGLFLALSLQLQT
jgi:hypothetical protein